MSGLLGSFKEATIYKCPKCEGEAEYKDVGKLLMTPLAGDQEVELRCKNENCKHEWKEKMK